MVAFITAAVGTSNPTLYVGVVVLLQWEAVGYVANLLAVAGSIVFTVQGCVCSEDDPHALTLSSVFQCPEEFRLLEYKTQFSRRWL
jgi:hypothetical protein